MFFNGAIAGIYMARGLTNDSQDFNRRWEQSMRYGHEIAKMALSLNLTQAQIKQNKLLYDEEEIKRETEIAEKNGGEYTLWCEGWTPVDETEVKPFFNIRMKEIRVPVTNPFILMAGKLKMANYEVIKAENGYEISTEVGYMEFGDSLKAVTAPGEICPDIIYGGTSLTASAHESFFSSSSAITHVRKVPKSLPPTPRVISPASEIALRYSGILAFITSTS